MAHKNRSKHDRPAGREPTGEELRTTRAAAGLTLEQAARLIYSTAAKFEMCEDVRPGGLRMRPADFELLCIKTGQYSVVDDTHWRLVTGQVIEVAPPRKE
jgi:hypothetical protein